MALKPEEVLGKASKQAIAEASRYEIEIDKRLEAWTLTNDGSSKQINITLSGHIKLGVQKALMNVYAAAGWRNMSFKLQSDQRECQDWTDILLST